MSNSECSCNCNYTTFEIQNTGGGRPPQNVFGFATDNKNQTWATCPCNSGHNCADNYYSRNTWGNFYSGRGGSRRSPGWVGWQGGYQGNRGDWTFNNNVNVTQNKSIIYDPGKIPQPVNIAKVAVGSLITSAKWREIRNNIINVNNYRNKSGASNGMIGDSSLYTGQLITANNYNSLKTHLSEYTRFDIPTVTAGSVITAYEVNKLIDAVNGTFRICTCQCNYCTCQCNNCPCNIQKAYYCTCNCNYCTCNCNYSCTCLCNYG